jgi:hypothetical protein
VVDKAMTIKVKIKPDFKATLRFNDKREMDFFRFIMLRIRDDPAKNHPPISVKDPNGKVEAPVIVQAMPIKIETKPEVKYYTKEDLEKEGKIQCINCKKNTETNTCGRTEPSENYYWDPNGKILGCLQGERRGTIS